MVKELIMKTQWWDQYRSQIKGAIKSKAQLGGPVSMVCISGGPITCVEQQEIYNIKEQVCTHNENVRWASALVHVEY